MSNWQVGDRAIIAADSKCDPCDRFALGETCQLVAYVGTKRFHSGLVRNCWRVAVGSKLVWVNEVCLRKPYDPLEPASWEDMKDIYTPKELEVVI